MGLKKNILANYMGAGWNALMTVAFIPLYIRHMGIAAYGLIGVFTMLQGVFSLLDLGMAPTISREMARFRGDRKDVQFALNLIRSAEVLAVCLAALMTLGFLFASPWLARNWLSSKGLEISVVTNSLIIVGALISFRLVENIYRSALIGLQRQVALNIIIIIVATLRGIGAALVVIYISNSIQKFFIWQLGVSILSLVIFMICTYSYLPGSVKKGTFSIAALRSVGRFAAGAMAITGLSLLLSNVDKLLLSRLLPLEIFGYYAFALVVAQIPLGFVSPITQAFYPQFTALHGNDDHVSLAHAYHTSTQLVVVLLGTSTAFFLFFGRELLRVWTGDSLLSDRTYLIASILSAGSLLNGIMTIPYYLQLSAGWTGLAMRANALALVFVVPALLFLVPLYGVTAAAWVWLALNLSFVIAVIPIMHRRLLFGENWSWYRNDVCVPLTISLGTGWLLSSLLPVASSKFTGLFELAICASLMMLVTILAAPLMRRRILFTLRRQVPEI